jgi:hypothetical protein
VTPRLRAQHPNEPWLWRTDWAQRAVRETSEIGGWCLLGFAIVWNLFCAPLWFLVCWSWPIDAKTLLMAAFPIAGLLLLLLTAYQWLRRRKYGVSVCHIERVPIPLGATMRGELDVHLRELPAAGFALRLACVRRTVTGSGKNRSVRESVLWQDEQTVTHGVIPSPNGLRVPLRFDIPWECESSSLADPADVVKWRLYVSAEVPGIDYQSFFELPVFRMEDARDELAPRVHGVAAWQPPPEITIAADTIVVRPSARFVDWVAVLVFFPLWFGALALVHRFGVPLFIVAFFALFSALVGVVLVDFLIGRTTVRTDRSALAIRRTWLGLGRRHAIPASEITGLETAIGSTFGNRGYHDVHAVLRDGRKRMVAKHIRNRRDAEMLEDRLSQALGL